MTIAGALVAVAPSGAAAAAPPENPVQGVSAIDQYIEAIPTGSGPAPTGGRGSQPTRFHRKLRLVVRSEGGTDAEALIEVATAPSHGAPTRSTLPDQPRRDDAGEVAPGDPSPLDAVVSPIGEADEPRLLVLLALLGGMTLTAFGFAARRQRR